MAAKPVPIRMQAEAVERAAVNLGGHIANLKRLAQKGLRTPSELFMAESFYRDLVAAAITFRKSAERQAALDKLTEDLE